jgi:murein L,D-transpeptidase YafK
MSSTLPSRALALLGLVAAAVSLSACEDTGLSHRSLAPIPNETLALFEQAGVSKEAPTLIRAYKKEAEFEVWKMKPDGKYVKVKTYPICRWSGQLGPKTHEGDRQSPEGFYHIAPTQLNPNSSYYLSFNVGYPNAFDRAHGATGGAVMVHGICSSAGCFSMTDKQIAEIYAIVRTSLNAGQNAVQMQSFPFHMTAENLAKHRLDPHIAFWRQLKEGSDHFEATLQEPAVGVCNKHYVFDAQPVGGHLDPTGPCPQLRTDPQIAEAVAEKSKADEARIAELSATVRPVRLVYQDGGQHPAFASRVAEVSRPEALVPPTEIAMDEKPIRVGKTVVAKLAKEPSPGKGPAPTKMAKTGPAEPLGSAKTPAFARESVAEGEASRSREWLSLHKGEDPATTTSKSASRHEKDGAKKTKTAKAPEKRQASVVQ